jgi:hypothetical protein
MSLFKHFLSLSFVLVYLVMNSIYCPVIISGHDELCNAPYVLAEIIVRRFSSVREHAHDFGNRFKQGVSGSRRQRVKKLVKCHE